MTKGDPYSLERFLEAQKVMFETAIGELQSGSKHGHWMWFIFPQLAGLGRSATAIFYGIASTNEARAYLEHPLLGSRLRRCVAALQPWAASRSADQILGTVDAMKLRSSLTLFDCVEPDSIFLEGLENFFAGKRDQLTLALLDREQ